MGTRPLDDTSARALARAREMIHAQPAQKCKSPTWERGSFFASLLDRTDANTGATGSPARQEAIYAPVLAHAQVQPSDAAVQQQLGERTQTMFNHLVCLSVCATLLHVAQRLWGG